MDMGWIIFSLINLSLGGFFKKIEMKRCLECFSYLEHLNYFKDPKSQKSESCLKYKARSKLQWKFLSGTFSIFIIIDNHIDTLWSEQVLFMEHCIPGTESMCCDILIKILEANFFIPFSMWEHRVSVISGNPRPLN